MAVTYFPVPIDVGELGIAGDIEAVWVQISVRAETGEEIPVMFPADGKMFASGSKYRFKGGSSLDGLQLPTKTGANLTDWEYEARLEVERANVPRQILGPYYLAAPTTTTAKPLASWAAESFMPASWMTAAVAQLQAAGAASAAPAIAAKDAAIVAKDQAVAAADRAVEVTGIDTSVAAVDFALTEPGPAATLSAANAAAIKPVRSDLEAVRGNPRAPQSGAVITFVDDDCDQKWLDIWKPICDAQGIKISLCAIAGRVAGDVTIPTGKTTLSLAQLKAIEADGHDILSHGWEHLPTTTATISDLDEDFRKAREWMDVHFPRTADVVVYPGGLHAPADKAARKATIRKHFRYGISTTSAPFPSPEPVDNWDIGRPNWDTDTEATMKAQIDAAVAQGKWLVIMTHAYELDYVGAGRAANVARLNAVIDYAQSLNVPILPWSEAEKVKGNAIAIGEYTSTGKERMFVSQRGVTTEAPRGGDKKGKFTPTVYGATTAGAPTYTTQQGFYEVVNGLVFFRGTIRIAAAASAAIVGAQAAVNIGTGGDLVVSINGGAPITATIPSGDTPAQAAAKVATAIGAAGSCGIIGGIFRLTTTLTGPASTATIVSGGGTILSNLGLTAGQAATGSGWDPATTGALRIGGIPGNRSLRDNQAHPFPINYNYLNLPTGYLSVWGKFRTGTDSYIDLNVVGTGVNENFLNATAVDPTKVFQLNFATVYMLSDPAWTSL